MSRPFWIRTLAVVALLVQLLPLAGAALCLDRGRGAAESCEAMGMTERALTAAVVPASDCHPLECPLMGTCAPPPPAWRASSGVPDFTFATSLVSDARSPLAPVSFDPSPTSPPPQA
ncbi:MAG TPA: hypothetical protein VNL98_05285 [Gemmatimonadales bacterium]|nr:hypothetical protein [Gemmatimonadales bacterium]